MTKATGIAPRGTSLSAEGSSTIRSPRPTGSKRGFGPKAPHFSPGSVPPPTKVTGGPRRTPVMFSGFRTKVAQLRAELFDTPTVGDLCSEVLARSWRQVDMGELAKSTAQMRDSVWRNHLARYERVRATLLTAEDIEALKHEYADRRHLFNHAIKLLRLVFDLAIDWGHRKDNPARDVERYPETTREQYLTASQMRDVLGALDDLDRRPRSLRSMTDAIRLCIYTGARRRESTNLQWVQVHLDLRIIRCGVVKRRERRYALCFEAVEMLRARPRKSQWVFPGRFGDKPVQNTHKTWHKALEVAGCPPMPLHCARHSWVTVAAQVGSMEHARTQLNHTTQTMTSRYSHLQVRDALPTVDRVGSAIAGPEQRDLFGGEK